MFKKLIINGHTVLFAKNNSRIGVVRYLVNAGSGNESPSNYGVAHFLEHMMFKGTKKRSSENFQKEAANYGNINAFTGHDVTCYLLDFLTQEIEGAFDLFFDMIFNAEIPSSEIKKERGVILEEEQSGEDDPDSFFYSNTHKHTFGPIAHSIIGTKQTISSMTRAKISSFKNNYYNSENAVIIVVGKINEDKLRSILSKVLPDQSGAIANKTIKPQYNWDEYKFFHKSKQAIISYTSPSKTLVEDPKGRIVRSIFHNGFNGGPHSLLFDQIREKMGLCYSVYSWNVDNKTYGANIIQCSLDKKNIKKAKEAIDKVVVKVLEEGFSEDFLDLAKKNYFHNVVNRFETSHGLAVMAINYFKNSEIYSFKEYQSAIKKVTNEDIIEFANFSYGDPNKIKFCEMTEE